MNKLFATSFTAWRMQFKAILILLMVFSAVDCTAQKTGKKGKDQLQATALKPFGRSVINKEQNLELISSGVHFGLSFEGNECKIYVANSYQDGHNYLQYELDGVYQKRIKIAGKPSEPIVIASPSSGKHTLWIYKATEAHTGAVVIQKVEAKNIKSIERPEAPIIEFIGNSITCGAAADPSETPCGSGSYHDQHNAYMAYGPRVARRLKTNFILSSVSGIGVYRNWNSNGPTMPQVYEKTDFHENSQETWNFNRFTPSIVSIALGTNDFSNGDGKSERLPFDSAAFVDNYLKFIGTIKAKYPKTQIVLLSSAMLNGESRIKLENCLTAVKARTNQLSHTDEPIELFFFETMQAGGCSGHPSVEDHKILADQLHPFFEKLLR